MCKPAHVATVRETAIGFPCGDEQLIGVLSLPTRPESDAGVLVIVGGPQYRVGSHRQFVQLARAIAAAGFPVMRFDYRGMGDSLGPQRNFENITEDIASAIDAFAEHLPGLRRIVLWGLCDGASAALLYLHDAQKPDPRIAGLCLLNPWVRSDASLARTHVRHYYLRRLRQRDFWVKLLRGAVALQALRDLAANLRAAFGGAAGSAGTRQPLPYQQRMASAWASFAGPVLLLLSEHDYTAREFIDVSRSDPLWRRALGRRPATTVLLAGADHTCSQPSARSTVERTTIKWLARHGHSV